MLCVHLFLWISSQLSCGLVVARFLLTSSKNTAQRLPKAHILNMAARCRRLSYRLRECARIFYWLVLLVITPATFFIFCYSKNLELQLQTRSARNLNQPPLNGQRTAWKQTSLQRAWSSSPLLQWMRLAFSPCLFLTFVFATILCHAKSSWYFLLSYCGFMRKRGSWELGTFPFRSGLIDK